MNSTLTLYGIFLINASVFLKFFTFFVIYAITVGAKKENNGIFRAIIKAIATINRIFQTIFAIACTAEINTSHKKPQKIIYI